MAVKIPRPIAEVRDSVAYLVNSICDPVSHVGCDAVRLVKQVDRGLKYRLQKLVHSVSPLNSDGAETPRPDELVAQTKQLRMLCDFRTDQTRSGPGYDPANRGRMNPAVPSGFPCSVHPAGTGRVASDLPAAQAAAQAAAFAVAVVVQTVAWGSAFRQPFLPPQEFLSVLRISCKTVHTRSVRKKIIFPRMFDLNVEE
jgi:hypothetical protein